MGNLICFLYNLQHSSHEIWTIFSYTVLHTHLKYPLAMFCDEWELRKTYHQVKFPWSFRHYLLQQKRPNLSSSSPSTYPLKTTSQEHQVLRWVIYSCSVLFNIDEHKFISPADCSRAGKWCIHMLVEGALLFKIQVILDGSTPYISDMEKNRYAWKTCQVITSMK